IRSRSSSGHTPKYIPIQEYVKRKKKPRSQLQLRSPYTPQGRVSDPPALTCQQVETPASLRCAYALPRRRRNLLLNRRANQIPPLRPRPVVILHVVVPQQILQ